MEKYWYIAVIAYLILVNLLGFILMAVDKKRAIQKKWRIRESTLFIVAIIGGSIGSILGMYTFRHKTKHTSFVIGMPLILVLQLALGIFLSTRFLQNP